MEPEGSLPCSQVLASGPYPETTESGQHSQTPFLKVHFNIY